MILSMDSEGPDQTVHLQAGYIQVQQDRIMPTVLKFQQGTIV